MQKGIIIFMVEGPSDHDALIPYIEQQLIELKIKVTIKEMHGDILTEYEDGTRQYKITSGNVRKQVKDLILSYLASTKIKLEQIKPKDIIKVYYVTDTDYCFSQQLPNSLNKVSCLNTVFNFNTIELIKNRKIPFETIFFAKHLEHIIANDERNFSDYEKTKTAIEFGARSLEEEKFFINIFRNNDIKKWNTYRESYNGIKIYIGRACNMNNLLDEIDEWKFKE
jgi:hypothetical protein